MSVGYAKLVVQVGSLCFFETESSQFLFGKATYYWKFKDSSVYYGPFNTLLEAGEHVDKMMGLERQLLPAAGGQHAAPAQVPKEEIKNVIKIDFKTKKRIE